MLRQLFVAVLLAGGFVFDVAAQVIPAVQGNSDTCEQFRLRVQQPTEGVDYKMRLSAPVEGVEYKGIVSNPCPAAAPNVVSRPPQFTTPRRQFGNAAPGRGGLFAPKTSSSQVAPLAPWGNSQGLAQPDHPMRKQP